MKKLNRILSLFFALLVFFSSSSFMVGLHLCNGTVQNIALFSKAEGCKKEKQLPPCHRHKAAPCCEDKTVVKDALGFKDDIKQITFAATPVVAAVRPHIILSKVIPSLVVLHSHFYNYDPPLRLCDLTIALQIFLI